MEHTPQSFRDIFTASEHRSAATVCRHLLVCVCLTLSLPLLAQEEDIDPYASIDGITMQETSRAIQKRGPEAAFGIPHGYRSFLVRGCLKG